MVVAANEVFVAPLPVSEYGGQVGLGARRKKKSRFFTGQVGHSFLEFIDRGVFAKDVVAHFVDRAQRLTRLP